MTFERIEYRIADAAGKTVARALTETAAREMLAAWRTNVHPSYRADCRTIVESGWERLPEESD